MEKKKRKLKLTTKNAIAGYLFILPFLIGFFFFMLKPMLESIRMVFSNVNIDAVNHGFAMEFTGLDNLNKVFFIDPEFVTKLREELVRMVLNVPAIIIFSFFIAILLNQKFKGRGFVRSIFFLPVILSAGVMVGLETDNTLLNGMQTLISESNAAKNSITGVLEEVLISEGVGSDFMEYVLDIVNQVYNIAIASGIQIIIFLSGLQTITPSMFEAARIEGATEWESFWKITLPMVSSLILVNIIYSIIDYFIRTDNEVMKKISDSMTMRMEYGFSTAMAWVYFLIVAVIIGIVSAIISKKVYYYE